MVSEKKNICLHLMMNLFKQTGTSDAVNYDLHYVFIDFVNRQNFDKFHLSLHIPQNIVNSAGYTKYC